jgi:large subunit ribosomal protein L9
VVNLTGSGVVPFILSKTQPQLQKGLVMKVVLLKDVYKLGRAGDIKKVADGFGRNYLVPQGLALPATAGSIKLAASIGKKATEQRVVLNNELKGVAELLVDLTLDFSVKAGETGKLYGSVSSQMIADKVKELKGLDLDRRQIAMEPIRNVGEYKIPVHLTIDLIPEITVKVRREGEVARAEAVRTMKVEAVVVQPEKVVEAVVETPVVETPASEQE